MRMKWIIRFVTAIGFLLLLYPAVGNMFQRYRQSNVIASYQSDITKNDKEEIENEIRRAQEYNSMLFQSAGAVVDNMDQNILSDESYQSILSQSNSVMGSIEIPRIDVDLPIYHGTSEEVLSGGAGHQQGTSMPVGGENTHCVLTGHRGLPGASLFTRLDELAEGDLFFLKVMGQILAYRVFDTEIVEPDNTDILSISPGRDECSLVTCTPYGLNTHRLVIHGERVPYKEAEYEEISAGIPSERECFLILFPFILAGVMLVVKLWDWREKKYAQKYKKISKTDMLDHRHDPVYCRTSGRSSGSGKRRRKHGRRKYTVGG